jgi:hypothetical protein
MSVVTGQGELHLNDIHVGTVISDGVRGSWGYGRFTPNEAFAKFAPLFGVWSLLVHEEDGGNRTPREALDELRHAEVALDSLRAELRWLHPAERMPLLQVNIDGPLIEWKLQ